MASSVRGPCPHCPGSSKLYAIPHGIKIHIARKHRDSAVRVVANGTSPSHLGFSVSQGAQTGRALLNLPSCKSSIRVLKHIPKGARCLAAGTLSSVIDKCLTSNATNDWSSLLMFAFTALRLPDQNNKKSLTAKVKENIVTSELNFLTGDMAPNKPPSLYKAVQTKVFEGDLKGAARLLTSDCCFAPVTEDTLTALKEKHPTPPRPGCVVPNAESTTDSLCFTVSTEKVADALQSFYRGSAGGLDGLRPEHLKEMLSPSAGDNGPRLLESLTHLCNFLLKGNLNPEICPFLYGGSLCALQKKDGGIRPIAVGNTFRRLVAKLCCCAVKLPMATYLQPHQIGFGTPRGCEAAIHATRAFAMHEKNCVIIKLDIRNAFNSINREVMLKEVKELTPSIYSFLRQCYSNPSYLTYNNEIILSQMGAQQGDPLGPLVFCLSIQKAISALKSPLNVWYLDDGTIGGSPDVVERDLQFLFPALKELGLEVNTTKCEFYACSAAATESRDRFASLIPGLRSVDKGSLSLLGAPVFAEGVIETLEYKTAGLVSLADHFKFLPAHVSLALLRGCFSLPKLTHVMRTAPTWKFPEAVARFDQGLKWILEGILNVELVNSQWSQASLPIRFGGLGVRRLQEVGPIAFLASAYGVAELVTHILSGNGDLIRIPYAPEARGVWSNLCADIDLPKKPEQQRGWDDALSRKIFSELQDGSTGVDLARVRASAQPESGAWLHALPSPHVGTLLDDDSLRVAAALRLGCDVCEPHTCICGVGVEANGHHGLSCTRCVGRRPRHHAINEILRRALVAADVPSVLEPPGLSRSDGKRPDGLTLVPWRRGRCLVWDATCVSTFASCHLTGTQKSAGAGAEMAAKSKHLKYACLDSAYDFIPFAVETAGPWSAEAKKFVVELGHRLREKSSDHRVGWFLTQQISLAIQRGNAASVLGTFGQGSVRGGLFDLI